MDTASAQSGAGAVSPAADHLGGGRQAQSAAGLGREVSCNVRGGEELGQLIRADTGGVQDFRDQHRFFRSRALVPEASEVVSEKAACEPVDNEILGLKHLAGGTVYLWLIILQPHELFQAVGRR